MSGRLTSSRRLRSRLWAISCLAAISGCDQGSLRESTESPRVMARHGSGFMPAIKVVSAALGDTAVFGGADEPGSVLMFASTTCAACEMSLPSWHQLVESHSSTFRFARLHPLAEYDEEWVGEGPASEVLGFMTRTGLAELQQLFELNATPTFILLAPEGEVVRIIVGRLTLPRVEQLRDALDSLLRVSGDE